MLRELDTCEDPEHSAAEFRASGVLLRNLCCGNSIGEDPTLSDVPAKKVFSRTTLVIWWDYRLSYHLSYLVGLP